MILVTGANGNLGSQTIDFLLEKSSAGDLAGLVRSEQKGAELKEKGVEIRIGDYNNRPSIDEAVKGIDTLLLISSSSLQGRVDQHRNVIEAARDAEVEQIFYTSILQADKELSPLSPDHAKTEELIKASGIPFTIHRHTFYIEFLSLFTEDAYSFGSWIFPSDGRAINLALRLEMAEALANGLADPGKHRNSIYEITSNRAYTLQEIVHELSFSIHRPVTYEDLPVSKFEKLLNQRELPEEEIAMNVMTARTFVNGGLEFTFDDLENLIGREPIAIGDII